MSTLFRSSPMFDSIEIVRDRNEPHFHDLSCTPGCREVEGATTIFCDNCEGACFEGHGDPDRATFCCRCLDQASKPYGVRVALCDECQRRKSGGAA